MNRSGNSYSDDKFEYRHVQLPKTMLKLIPDELRDESKGTLKLLWEEEWRSIGITQVGFSSIAIDFASSATSLADSSFPRQSLGWEHYEVHEPEPHILLFKYEHAPPPL